VADLTFAVRGVRPEPFAATPTMACRLAVRDAEGGSVHALLLRTQVRIEPQRRGYAPAEEERLTELFGERPRWGETLRPFLWAQLATTVPGFEGETEVDLLLPCTYDFEVAAAKYLHGLDEGEVPLLFLFSGTVFVRSASGFAVEPVPWDREARFPMPVSVWRETMDHYFPGGGWLRLSRASIDALARFKAGRALATWDDTVEALMAEVGR
jgi:uncharacterized protein DUF6084